MWTYDKVYVMKIQKSIEKDKFRQLRRRNGEGDLIMTYYFIDDFN